MIFNSNIQKKAMVGAAIAALAAGAVSTAAPAQAQVVHAYTVVTWGGTPCIETRGAMVANPYRIGYATTCDYGPGTHWAYWTEDRSSGEQIGEDPIMGNADWIGCTVTVDGTPYSSYASAGDGRDVNCLRTVN